MKLGLKLHEAAIDRLPKPLKGALAAACTQRQAEAYRACKARTGGNSKEFDDLLDLMWHDSASQRASEQEHKRWEAAAEKLYHARANKIDMYQPNEACALESLLETNDVLMNGKAAHTIHAAHHAFMSVWNFLTNPLGKTPEIVGHWSDEIQRYLVHPLAKAEHQRQERDLFDVERAIFRQERIPDVVERLRSRAETDAHSFVPILKHTAT